MLAMLAMAFAGGVIGFVIGILLGATAMAALIKHPPER
jgi:ABC-type phosphate/phosphonate transport system permease subunit